MTESERITDLELRLGELEAQQKDVRTQLFDAQIELWEGRVDDLAVQMHLLTLDARDRLQPVVDKLQARLLDARSEVEKRGDTANEMVGDLRRGVQSAVDDVRTAVRDAATAARS